MKIINNVILYVNGIVPPSFKNHKRSGVNRNTGKLMSYTRRDIKMRMKELEDAILSCLYSVSQTGASGTDLACRKQLRTLLSGLCDDSVREVPEFTFKVYHVSKGQEGVNIVIERIGSGNTLGVARDGEEGYGK